MNVQMPDGTVITDVPEGTTKSQLMARYNKLMAEETDQRGTFADPLAQGATLGFSDELAGLFGATYGTLMPESLGGLPDDISFGDAYRGIREQALERKQAFEQRNPATSLGLELAGGFATGGVGAGRAAITKSVSGIPKYFRYAAAGAVPGGVAGAGYADPGDRTQSAVTGTVVGGAFGAGLPAAANAFKGLMHSVQTMLGRPATVAERKLAEAMARDGVTPEQIARRLMQRPRTTIPDVAGENVRGLTRAAASFPGKAKQAADRFLTERQFGSGSRIKRSLASTFSDTDDVYGMIDKVNEVARQKARPLYDQAYKRDIPFTDKMQSFLKKPSIAAAYKKAKRIFREDTGEELPQVFRIEDDKVVEVMDKPTMQVWDYIVRGLNDVVEESKDEFGRIRGAWGSSVNKTRRELDNLLKQHNPAYRAAKQVWSTKSRYEEALQKGQKLLSGDVDVSRRMIATMTPEEKDMFRVGAAKALRDKINKMGDQFDVSRRIFGNKDVREKLRLAFPNQKAFNTFKQTALREQQMANTKAKVLGNSVTARLEAEKSDMLVDPGIVSSMLRNDWAGAAGNVARSTLNRAKVPTERLGDELTTMLLDPRQAQATLQRMHLPDQQTLLNLQRLNAGLLGGGNAALGILSQ